MSDFFDGLLGGPPNRPQHPDFMKLADILLRHDGPTTDPTTMENFSMMDRIAEDIDPEVLTYMSQARAAVYLRMVEQELGTPISSSHLVSMAGSWVDGFLVGIEWQKAQRGEPRPDPS